MKNHLKNMMFFDMFAFEALIIYLYGKTIDGFHKAYSHNRFSEGEVDSLENSKKYRDYQKKRFSKSYLSDGKKLEQTMKVLKHFDLDVLFVQEADQYLVEQI